MTIAIDGVRVAAGRYGPEAGAAEGRVFVSVDTTDHELMDKDGNPLVAVLLNDAVLYDKSEEQPVKKREKVTLTVDLEVDGDAQNMAALVAEYLCSLAESRSPYDFTVIVRDSRGRLLDESVGWPTNKAEAEAAAE